MVPQLNKQIVKGVLGVIFDIQSCLGPLKSILAVPGAERSVTVKSSQDSESVWGVYKAGTKGVIGVQNAICAPGVKYLHLDWSDRRIFI